MLNNKLEMAVKVKPEPKAKQEPKENNLVSTESQTTHIDEENQPQQVEIPIVPEIEPEQTTRTRFDVASLCELGNEFIRTKKLNKKLFAEKVLRVDSRRFCDVLKRKPRWSLMRSPRCKNVLLELREFFDRTKENQAYRTLDAVEKAKTLMRHTKIPVEVIARDFLNIDQDTFQALVGNTLSVNQMDPNVLKRLRGVSKWIFDYPYEFISLKKNVSVRNLVKQFTEDLERNGVTLIEFAKRFLRSNSFHIKRIVDSPKYWSCYTENMLCHLNAIYNWLNDAERWNKFRNAEKTDYYNGYNAGKRRPVRADEVQNQNEVVEDGEIDGFDLRLSEFQRDELEKAFQNANELDDGLLASLSEKLELSFGTISEWFSIRAAELTT